ncbi:cyclin-L1-like [Osmerus eperlanus]|uniref:cyclin-L1-like n=1 Tax=Osmerus eperlanus TaxID=29151 RepID=UPI002E0E5926
MTTPWDKERVQWALQLWRINNRRSSLSPQPNYDHLEKEVERRKIFLQEDKLKAKGLNPDGTPALSALGGFSPVSTPCSPHVVKSEDKSPNPQNLKPVKKEPDNRAQSSKSPRSG